jgi:hypothetical protein
MSHRPSAFNFFSRFYGQMKRSQAILILGINFTIPCKKISSGGFRTINFEWL